MMLLSYERIEKEKEQINKINVFPVPDQDTGNNMAKTLAGIKSAIEKKEFKNLEEISAATLDGALAGAQGNAGVIYTGFLAGFLPQLDKNPVNAKKLALAFEKGAERARESIQNPKEGTILDVIKATAETFKKESKKENDIINILKVTVGKANEALLATREKMEIFRKANVVDAGGLGFLMVLESYLEALEGKEEVKKREEKPSGKIKKFVQVLSNRYEVVSLIENPKFSEKVFQEKLKKMGNSLDIVQIRNKMKLHIHTDYPDEVKKILRESGKISDLRIEDMAKEVAGEESVRKISIGIVTEDIAMLLPKIIEKYQIEIASTKYEWLEEKDLPGENIYQKMREAERRGIKTSVKTSQATPKDYLDAFEKQLKRFDKVLGITVTSKASGCYNSACQAKEMLKEDEKERVYILDSLQAAASQALLVLRAIELAQEQREIIEIIDELKNLIPQTHLYLLFEDPKWVESISRITKSQANWIRRMKKLRLHPLITLKNGMMAKAGVVFAKDMAETLFKKILKESQSARKRSKTIRVVIGHADNLEAAEKLKKMLKDYNPRTGASAWRKALASQPTTQQGKFEIPFITPGPPIICAGAGPGTLLAGWMPLET